MYSDKSNIQYLYICDSFKKQHAILWRKKQAISRAIIVPIHTIRAFLTPKIWIIGIVVTLSLLRICLYYSHVLKKLFEEYWDLNKDFETAQKIFMKMTCEFFF